MFFLNQNYLTNSKSVKGSTQYYSWKCQFGSGKGTLMFRGCACLDTVRVEKSLLGFWLNHSSMFVFFFFNPQKPMGGKRSSGCVCRRQFKVQQENIWAFAKRAALHGILTQCRNVSYKHGVLKGKPNGAHVLLLPD